MTVYLIETGEYSDRDIIAVFSNKEAANLFASLNDGHVLEFEVDDTTVEELNNEIQEMINTESLGYRFEFDRHGEVSNKEESRKIASINSEFLEPTIDFNDHIFIAVCAKNMDSDEEYNRCLKIASDKRAKFLSEYFGL